MKKRNLLKKLAVFLAPLAFLFSGLFVSATTVEAKELTDVVVSLELLTASNDKVEQQENGSYHLGQQGTQHHIRGEFDLSAYDNNLADGDNFSVFLPEGMKMYQHDMDLVDPKTKVAIASLKSFPDERKVVITLKNLEEFKEAKGGDGVTEVTGNFLMKFAIDDVVTDQTYTFDSPSLKDSISWNLTTRERVNYQVGQENYAKILGHVRKEEWSSDKLKAIGSVGEGNYQSYWLIRINTEGQTWTDGNNENNLTLNGPLTLTDEISLDGQFSSAQFIPEKLLVSTGTFDSSRLNTIDNKTPLVEGQDYTIEWNANYTKFTIVFNDPDRQYLVEYYTTTPNDGTYVSNTAKVNIGGEDMSRRSNINQPYYTHATRQLFTGEIQANTAYKVRVKKVDAITLRPLGGATFTVTDPDGGVQTITTDENGEAITTAYAASFENQDFTVTETKAPAGYTLPAEASQVVKLGKDGTTITFYDEPQEVEVALRATKELEGRDLKDQEFSFKLTNKATGEEIETVKNDATGNVAFAPIKLTEVGTFTYTIEEVAGDDDTVIYDATKHDVTVTVTADARGVLSAVVENDGVVNFTNKLVEPVKVTIEATKALTGRDLTADEFTFNLLDQASQVVATAKNTADGKVVFTDVEFTSAGNYNYSIQEVNDSQKGITYDEEAKAVTIEVTNNAGVLTANVTSEAPTFTNAYAANSTKLTIKALKQIVGEGAPELQAGEFEFELLDSEGNVVQTATNDSLGAIEFADVEFTKVGTFNFTIKEKNGTVANIKYDLDEKPVTVEVKDVDGDLQAKVVSPEEPAIPTISNEYITTTTTTETTTTTQATTTTVAPTTTTEATTTTVAPTTTTVAPTTTEAPVVTTEAPVVTTEAPVVTTEAPVVTTEAPVITTEAPVVTTEAPVVTTEAPVITTEAPVVTTEAPTTTTTPAKVIIVNPTTTTTQADPTTASERPSDKGGKSPQSGRALPSTGETVGIASLVGVSFLALTGFIYYRRQKN